MRVYCGNSREILKDQHKVIKYLHVDKQAN